MKDILKNLKRMLKGRMSPLLKEAITESIKAIKDGNINLAYQITACKSLIIATLKDDKVHAFRESIRINEKILGDSLYSLLDGVHFSLAMAIGNMPAGMVIVTKVCEDKYVCDEIKHEGTHYIVKRIKLETEETYKRVRESWRE